MFPTFIAVLGMWVSLSCTTFSMSLDQATVQIAVPTPVPTQVQLPPDAIVLDVRADKGWQDTGLQVVAEQQFQVAYESGHVIDQATVIEDGNGWNYICGRASCCEPLPTARRSALIGKIDKQTFFIGNGGVFSAPRSGHLFLRINDCDEGLYDNSGVLQVGFYP
jgi:hypothetical protein